MSKIDFDLQHPDKISKYLFSKRLIKSISDVQSVEKAGDSNMNFTVRVNTKASSIILKQSKPYVEKYPKIPAPEHRVSMESRFYDLVSRSQQLSKHMPKVLFRDPEQDVLILEDLGLLSSFEDAYRGERIQRKEIDWLIGWLKGLHDQPFSNTERQSLENREMRLLNHEHIFDLPLREDNGLVLDKITPGLSALARRLQQNKRYTQRVHALGEIYLSNYQYLLHGDYYPASWIRWPDKVYIIDAEFAFFGAREFDLGVMLAHLWLSRQSKELIDYCQSQYDELEQERVRAFCGIEIMRRLLGVAQLPISLSLAEKDKLLDKSIQLVLSHEN